MFEEVIEEEETMFVITVCIPIRTHSYQEKKIYTKDPITLLPLSNKDSVELIDSPSKKVSNINKDKYCNCGVWKYKKIQPTTRRKRTVRKKSSTK